MQQPTAIGIILDSSGGFGHQQSSISVAKRLIKLHFEEKLGFKLELPIFIFGDREQISKIEILLGQDNSDTSTYFKFVEYNPKKRNHDPPVDIRPLLSKVRFLISGGGGYEFDITNGQFDQFTTLQTFYQLQPFGWGEGFAFPEKRKIYHFSNGKLLQQEAINGEIYYIPMSPGDVKSDSKLVDSTSYHVLIYLPAEAQVIPQSAYQYYHFLLQKLAQVQLEPPKKLVVNLVDRALSPEQQQELINKFPLLNIIFHNNIESEKFNDLIRNSKLVLAEGANTISQAAEYGVPYLILDDQSGNSRATPRYPSLGLPEYGSVVQDLQKQTFGFNRLIDKEPLTANSFASIPKTSLSSDFLAAIITGELKEYQPHYQYFKILQHRLIHEGDQVELVRLRMVKQLQQQTLSSQSPIWSTATDNLAWDDILNFAKKNHPDKVNFLMMAKSSFELGNKENRLQVSDIPALTADIALALARAFPLMAKNLTTPREIIALNPTPDESLSFMGSKGVDGLNNLRAARQDGPTLTK